MLKQSDAALVQLATMAAAAVLIWEQLRRVPEPWQGRARSAYLFGLSLVFVYFTGASMEANSLVMVLFVLTFVVGGSLAIWLGLRKPAQQSAVDDQSEKESK